jgi:hypothetical protein
MKLASLVASALVAGTGIAHADSAGAFEPGRRLDRFVRSTAKRSPLDPQVRITSPLNGGLVRRGEALEGQGSPNGTGFAINLEILTRDDVGVEVNEATVVPGDPGIRNVDALGGRNPEFPGLFVFIDQDLITPDGEIIPAFTNLGPLFNVAGTDDTPGPGVTIWAGWHVLESFRPGTEEFTLTAAVIDQHFRIGFDRVELSLDDASGSANDLTPDPSTYPLDFADSGEVNADGPLVEIVAPRVPSSIAVGEQVARPTALNGSLNFIQVNILDVAGAGIAVDEIGETVTVPELGFGSILDPAQLGKFDPAIPGSGDNANIPGLLFTFDVPLRAPTGVEVPAGGNLSPVFNIVGSEIDPLTGKVHVVADWVVGGSLIVPEGKEFLTFTAKVTDNAGNAGIATRTFRVSEVVSGQDLTPAP